MIFPVSVMFLIASAAPLPQERFWEECRYVLGVSRWAYQMAHHEGVPEEMFHIADDDRYPEEREMMRAIVKDVYHNLENLRNRVERACAPKEKS